jgi:ubiquinone/menaquinone biosynthesis C-methylase UbiE
MFLRRLILIMGTTIVAATVAASSQQAGHADVPREQWQRHTDILSEVGATNGATIADIGAGGGWFTRRISKAVGDSGRVFAVDVNPVSLRELREALGADYANVVIVRGDEDDPKLPAATLDGALIVNAYHEFAEYPKMLAHLRNALKANGKLVILEPIPRSEDTTRAAQTKRHAIHIGLVEQELKDAGFEIVKKDPLFLSRPGHAGDATGTAERVTATDWLVVARRPKD